MIAHPAQIEIDLDALVGNLGAVRRAAPGSDIMAVVKSNAYGMGRRQVARTLFEEGVHWFGVSRLSEALALRAQFDDERVARDEARILTWLCPVEESWNAAVDAGIDVSVSNREQLASAKNAGRARVHLKVDVGMGRGGALGADFLDLLDALAEAVDAREVEFVALWSHLSCADDPGGAGDEVTKEQLRRFQDAQEEVRRRGLTPQFCHLAASAGALLHPSTQMDLVRPGLALYGHSPTRARTSQDLGLTPIATYRAPIVQVKRVSAGDTISYGATWTAPGPRWVGLLPVGYADGVPRTLDTEFTLENSGKRARILGRVCMDQVIIDLGCGDQPLANTGEGVVLLGDPAAGQPSAQDWGDATGTSNYEIVARLPEHIERVHLRRSA